MRQAAGELQAPEQAEAQRRGRQGQHDRRRGHHQVIQEKAFIVIVLLRVLLKKDDNVRPRSYKV